MKEIWLRFTMEAPTFWKRMGRVLVSMGVLAGLIIPFDIQYPNYLPEIVVKASGYLATAGLFGAFLSTLTVKDRYELKEKKMEMKRDK